MSKKIPSEITFGPYEINIMGDYVRLQRMLESQEIVLKNVSIDKYLDDYKTHLKHYCEANDYDFENYFGPKHPIIVDFTTHAFEQHLGHCLVSYDVNKISSLLDYQRAAYKGDPPFTSIVEHGTYDCVKRLSKFDNQDRLKEIMKWVNAKRKFTPAEESVKDAKKPVLIWSSGDKKKLKELSRRIWKSKATERELDFYRAVENGTIAKWNLSAEFLAYLIYKLFDKKLIICRKTRGHFKATEAIFDYDQKSNPKFRLSELSSRINKDIAATPSKREKERDFVSI